MLPKVFILGNATSDPLIGISNNGIKYARLSIACNEIYNKNKPNNKSHFFNCVAWRKTAEYIGNHIKKGDGVFAELHLFNNSYTNNQGKVIYNNDLVIDNIQITNHRSKNSNSKFQSNDLIPPINSPLTENNDFPNENNDVLTDNNESSFMKDLAPETESINSSNPDIDFEELFKINNNNE